MVTTYSLPEVISETQTDEYSKLLHEIKARRIPFAVGGSLAMAAYTGLSRVTKDLDLYVTPDTSREMIQTVLDSGFADYFDRAPYDRRWIFRAIKDDVIVDVIWAMANQRASVDSRWLTNGPQFEFAGHMVKVLPVEELIWSKVYVLQRDRCDWPDLFNVLDATLDNVDWRHLLTRLNQDEALLAALISVYTWLRPEAFRALPPWLPGELCLPHPRGSEREAGTARAALIDGRPWLIKSEQARAEQARAEEKGREAA